MIQNIIRKKLAKHYLSLLRGAGTLTRKNMPFFVVENINSLSGIRLKLSESDFNTFLSGDHSSKCENLVRQVLLLRHEELTSGIMKSIGNNSAAGIPLPGEWLKVLERKGIRINYVKSKILFFKNGIINLLKGIISSIKYLLTYKMTYPEEKPYVVFDGMLSNNIGEDTENQYTIINWYKRSKFYNTNIKKIWVKIIFDKEIPDRRDVKKVYTIIPKIKKKTKILGLFFTYILMFLYVIANALFGKWWHLYLYNDYVALRYIKSVPSDELADTYYIRNSNWYYKALWYEEIEKIGKDVIIYYYSTNGEPIQYGTNLKPPKPFGLESMSWNKFIVWDDRQRDFLRQFCPEAEFISVGYIDYADCDCEIDVDENLCNIAVFDVSPMRPCFHSAQGYGIAPYYTKEITDNFMKTILSVFADKKVHLYFKRKRKINSNFLNSSDGLILYNNYISEVNPDISARRLIEKCDAVISIPFTSTALLGALLHKPSVYFDPSNSIQYTEENHNIPVLRGELDLVKWSKTLNYDKRS